MSVKKLKRTPSAKTTAALEGGGKGALTVFAAKSAVAFENQAFKGPGSRLLSLLLPPLLLTELVY